MSNSSMSMESSRTGRWALITVSATTVWRAQHPKS